MVHTPDSGTCGAVVVGIVAIGGGVGWRQWDNLSAVEALTEGKSALILENCPNMRPAFYAHACKFETCWRDGGATNSFHCTCKRLSSVVVEYIAEFLNGTIQARRPLRVCLWGVGHLAFISKCQERYVATDRCWQITHRHIQRVLNHPPAPSFPQSKFQYAHLARYQVMLNRVPTLRKLMLPSCPISVCTI